MEELVNLFVNIHFCAIPTCAYSHNVYCIVVIHENIIFEYYKNGFYLLICYSLIIHAKFTILINFQAPSISDVNGVAIL